MLCWSFKCVPDSVPVCAARLLSQAVMWAGGGGDVRWWVKLASVLCWWCGMSLLCCCVSVCILVSPAQTLDGGVEFQSFGFEP